ncbi:MAG: large subunit ribosomal protein [Patescibacteria group bacterium]|jgi:large subunit ribosomal protein L19|nr:large subunit ribosomal protein [Patescibacteria group bacterium]
MHALIEKIENSYKKNQVVDVRSGDTVKVHQRIKEGNKERIQIFEGLVIRTDRKDSLTSTITVRRIASGVGVEKSFLLHSPLVEKVEVVKRSKVRRKYLSYMRNRSGKSARLASVDFDKKAVNDIKKDEPVIEATAEVAEAASVEEAKSE